MIRKLKSGQYRLYSRKTDPRTGRRRNLGTFATRAAAEKHEQAVQFSSVNTSEPGASANRALSRLRHLRTGSRCPGSSLVTQTMRRPR